MSASPTAGSRTDDGKAFFRLAAERKLIASIAMGPAWAPALAEVMDANPDLVVLLHHMGGISRDRAALPTSTPSPALAKYPNVHIKLSGFHYAVGLENGWDYPHPSAMWIAEGLYDAFGTRAMLGLRLSGAQPGTDLQTGPGDRASPLPFHKTRGSRRDPRRHAQAAARTPPLH